MSKQNDKSAFAPSRKDRCDALDDMEEWLDARRMEKEARKAYQGYEWGYHGYAFKERIDIAARKFEATMEDVMVNKMTEILAELITK